MADSILDAVAAFMRTVDTKPCSICVAVSGGSDSIALLHAAVALQESIPFTRIGVAHVNHGLRGEESSADEAFVRETALKLNLPYHVLRLSGKALHDPGVEAWAREERYRFFKQVKDQEKYNWIATGHTADDQAETVLMRLMRGTGFKGITGISPIRNDGVIRPFLLVRKKAILDWLEVHKIVFREDSSNSDLSFKRNRVRHEILPAMALHEPDIVDRIVYAAESARNAWYVLEPAIKTWIRSSVVSAEQGRCIIRKSSLDESALAAEALCELMRLNGIPFERSHIRAIVGLRLATETKVVLLPQGWRAILGRETIDLVLGADIRPPIFPSCGLAVPGNTPCPDGSIVTISEHDRESIANLETDTPYSTFIAADDGSSAKLAYRPCSIDEPFWPLGWPTPVPVTRFLKNQGVPHEARLTMGVIATKEGSIVWIPGLRLSEAFKVETGSKRILRLTYQMPQYNNVF